MPRVSKRKQRKESSRPETRYLRTYIYVRLSEKDGGHGRRDSIYIQKQICEDYAKKHPEMLVVKVYADNGVTGTTFQREEFENLMEDVANKKVDCIIVKDFARFGRDALDAVDLIDVIFPSLNIRFISVMDEYDSANPACAEDRTTNILKHFMNDYYAREVSEKLVQAHQMSRERGEFWGARPPYGYQRAEGNSKKLVPEPAEAEIVRQIFYWYVFEDMSSYDIARELNGKEKLGPEDSYRKRELGKEPEKRLLWRADGVRKILQNPVYTGAAVYGKTRQMLARNIPIQLIPKNQWEIHENAWDAVVERSIYEKAQEIVKERWKDTLDIWAANPKEKHGADGPFRGKIFCGHCGRRLGRNRNGGNEKYKYLAYRCPSFFITDHTKCFRSVNEIYVNQAVKAALCYQIQLAVESQKKYGEEFYRKLEQEITQNTSKARQKYAQYGKKLETLFEHYASGILERSEYQEIKAAYLAEQEAAKQKLTQEQLRGEQLLDKVRVRMDWTEELLKYQKIRDIDRGIADRFIEKVIVYSRDQIEVVFWFGDLFEKELEKELADMEGGLLYAI